MDICTSLTKEIDFVHKLKSMYLRVIDRENVRLMFSSSVHHLALQITRYLLFGKIENDQLVTPVKINYLSLLPTA